MEANAHFHNIKTKNNTRYFSALMPVVEAVKQLKKNADLGYNFWLLSHSG